jgi:hypothetical protein
LEEGVPLLIPLCVQATTKEAEYLRQEHAGIFAFEVGMDRTTAEELAGLALPSRPRARPAQEWNASEANGLEDLPPKPFWNFISCQSNMPYCPA